MKPTVLFLACDLSGYFAACLRALASGENIDVHVVHYAGDAHAPFEFGEALPHTTFYVKNRYDRKALCDLAGSLKPGVIICSGWADKDYLAVCRRLKGSARNVLLFDNPWQATARQRVATVAGPFFLRRHFDACWVSGAPQREYAHRLGYRESEISEGCYSCDYELFLDAGRQAAAAKQAAFPRRFLYVGRYIRIKGVEELWAGWQLFCDAGNPGWELWCVGKGDLPMPSIPSLRDFGFVQPREIAGFIEKTGVFVMPSHDDHWGVAVHEFAAAGFPLVCSRGAMAATAYLREGRNGAFHAPRDAASLAEAFRLMAALPAEKLLLMGKTSTILAGQMTPVIWASIVREYLAGGWPAFRFGDDRTEPRPAA
jgi:glycosyltransferase involved in cell wall biosynthesis